MAAARSGVGGRRWRGDGGGRGGFSFARWCFAYLQVFLAGSGAWWVRGVGAVDSRRGRRRTWKTISTWPPNLSGPALSTSVVSATNIFLEKGQHRSRKHSMTCGIYGCTVLVPRARGLCRRKKEAASGSRGSSLPIDAFTCLLPPPIFIHTRTPSHPPTTHHRTNQPNHPPRSAARCQRVECPRASSGLAAAWCA